MARVKKNEATMTLEKKLEQVLVPDWEWPYKLPENWCWAKLKSVSTHISDGSHNPPKDAGKGIPLLSATNIRDHSIDIAGAQRWITEEEWETENLRTRIEPNDVLLTIVATLGRTAVVKNERFALQRSVAVIKPRINSEYLSYYFESPYVQTYITDHAKGTAQKGFYLRSLEDLYCCIPPITEQQRIVDRIESLFAKLDEAKEKTQTTLDSFETRKAAILHKALTGELTIEWRKGNKHSSAELLQIIQQRLDAVKRKRIKKVHNEYVNLLNEQIPKEWLLVDLDSISRLITDGEHSTPRRVDSFCGYYLLSARNVHNDSLLLDDVDYIDKAEYDNISNRCNPQIGDVLLSCSGSVGRCCVISDNNKYCMVRSAAMLSVVECNPRFIMYMIQSDAVQEQIKRLSKQTAQANLFLGAIAALVIPLPSLEEQDEIVRILDSLFTKEQQAKDAAGAVLEQIDLMKKAILSRAFRGELGTNDPTEESAVELLKQIL